MIIYQKHKNVLMIYCSASNPSRFAVVLARKIKNIRVMALPKEKSKYSHNKEKLPFTLKIKIMRQAEKKEKKG